MKRFLFPLLLPVASCQTSSGARQAATPPPPEVGTITVATTPVPLARELPGRVSAFRVAEVRARVTGIVQKRLFDEGADVKENQPLFKIDPAPYEAALESAQAGLARAEATVGNRRLSAKRIGDLIATNAVARQEYDDALSAQKTAEADVAANRAAVKTARLNLGYTSVTSPIAGRIGRAAVTEGGFAQASSATLLATVQQLDPVYVDVTWSATELARLRQDIAAGKIQVAGGPAEVTVILQDGRPYAEKGKLEFADASVDPSTGSISLRAVVPNPRGELLPGLFVRARLPEGTTPNAILVPQKGVTRDATGRATALVVTADKKVERRLITTDRAVGNAWLVTEGLVTGDQVIVEGVQKVRPGVTVNPVPVAEKP